MGVDTFERRRHCLGQLVITWARGGGGEAPLLAGASGRGLICVVYWLGGRAGYTGHVICGGAEMGAAVSRPWK